MRDSYFYYFKKQIICRKTSIKGLGLMYMCAISVVLIF